MRVTDGPQRHLPQMRKLWRLERLLVTAERGACQLAEMTKEATVHEVHIMSPLFRYFRIADHPGVKNVGLIDDGDERR
jgi:hypothetical protein